MRKMALIEGRFEGLIMGMTEEAMEFPSLSGSLDFFLGKVSGMRNGRTVAPGVPEIPVGTAVAGERFPVIS